MAVVAEEMVTVEGIRAPDSRLAREITQLVRDTEPALLFHHSSRVYYWGALAESVVASNSIASFFMPGRCFTTWA